jgi:hypothetical protein
MNKFNNIEIQENDFEAQNKTIYAISNIKSKFLLTDGSIQDVYNKSKHKYELQNLNIYKKDTGKIISVGTQTQYNSDFIIRLIRLYILDVKTYLNYHFENSNNKMQFFEYVKYGATNSINIKGIGKKQAIKDWVNEQEQIIKLPPQQTSKQNSNINEENPIFKFENNFDSVEPKEIYRFFKEKLVDKRHLTLENLEKYLIFAFQEEKPPKPLMKFDNVTTKKKINTIFYTYYHDIAQKPHNKQTEYAELLGKYFQSYNTKTIKSNWSKGFEIKR